VEIPGLHLDRVDVTFWNVAIARRGFFGEPLARIADGTTMLKLVTAAVRKQERGLALADAREFS
jgi:hypothetical protein